jgi:hypothetical protein
LRLGRDIRGYCVRLLVVTFCRNDVRQIVANEADRCCEGKVCRTYSPYLRVRSEQNAGGILLARRLRERRGVKRKLLAGESPDD